MGNDWGGEGRQMQNKKKVGDKKYTIQVSTQEMQEFGQKMVALCNYRLHKQIIVPMQKPCIRVGYITQNKKATNNIIMEGKKHATDSNIGEAEE